MGERYLDTVEVGGSIPPVPTRWEPTLSFREGVFSSAEQAADSQNLIGHSATRQFLNPKNKLL